MSPGLQRAGVLILLGLSLAAVPAALLSPLARFDTSSTAAPSHPEPEAVAAAPPPDSLIQAAVRRTPFRSSRRPARIAFDPARGEGSASPAAPGQPRPVLVLTGIVWNEEPSAVIEGIPGSAGPRVVRRREVIGSLRVRRIERDQVQIAGPDTVWHLRVREPWK